MYLCTVKQASLALPPFALPTSCGPTVWSWTRLLSLWNSAAASSPLTSASWVSSSSLSPRSWPHPRAPQKRAVQPLARAAQSSTSLSPSLYTLQRVSSHSSTVPSPPLPAAKEGVGNTRLFFGLELHLTNDSSQGSAQNHSFIMIHYESVQWYRYHQTEWEPLFGVSTFSSDLLDSVGQPHHFKRRFDKYQWAVLMFNLLNVKVIHSMKS